jgi:hypothetical protein
MIHDIRLRTQTPETREYKKIPPASNKRGRGILLKDNLFRRPVDNTAPHRTHKNGRYSSGIPDFKPILG